MGGIGEQRPLIRQLHDIPQIHHGDPVAYVLHHAQVVGNEHIGELILVLQLRHQVEDLGLDGYIQGGNRLVAHDQPGIEGQGPGHADTLALAAGKLVGIAVDELLPDAHVLEQLAHLLDALRLGHPMGHQGFRHDAAHGELGVQGGIGILEDDLDLLFQGLFLVFGHLEQVLAIVFDGARRGGEELDDHLAGGGFAAAGFPHQAEGLPLVYVEADAVHRLHIALLGEEGLAVELDGIVLLYILYG